MNLTLNINGIEFKKNIILGTYAVNDVESREEWFDANGRRHKANIKHKLSGTFEMAFQNTAEYALFIGAIETVKNADGSLPVVASANNTMDNRLAIVDLVFEPKRTLGADNNDRIERFSVSLEEL